MFRTLTASFLTIVMLGTTAGLAQASGGGGFNQGFSQRKVDTLYEDGKSYYKARVDNGDVLSYCVKTGEELTKLSKRSLRALRGSNSQTLASSLYNCNKPEQSVVEVVGQEKMPAVIHYLNKRYKLKLSNT